MKFSVITPDRTVLEVDNVTRVTAETDEGQFGILPKHQPLTAALKLALVNYTLKGASTGEGATQVLAVMGGVLQTDGEKVTILSQAAELAKDIDEARAKQAEQRAKQRLADRSEDVDRTRAELALGRAITRMKAASLR